MIEILPIEDREREKSILGDMPTPGSRPRVLAMKDRGEELGFAALELLGEKLRILKLEAAGYDFGEKPQGEASFVLDALLRAAASYGETFGATEIETAFPDFYGFFKARGFKADDTHAFGPMGLIVRYE